jgi:hypothetical protein
MSCVFPFSISFSLFYCPSSITSPSFSSSSFPSPSFSSSSSPSPFSLSPSTISSTPHIPSPLPLNLSPPPPPLYPALLSPHIPSPLLLNISPPPSPAPSPPLFPPSILELIDIYDPFSIILISYTERNGGMKRKIEFGIKNILLSLFSFSPLVSDFRSGLENQGPYLFLFLEV